MLYTRRAMPSRFRKEARTRYRRGDKPVSQYRSVSAVSGRELTKDLRKLAAARPDKDFFVAVRLRLNGTDAWRSGGRWFNAADGSQIVVLDPTQYDMVALIDEGDEDDPEAVIANFDEVLIFSSDHVPLAGGCRPGAPAANDCLWRAVSAALNGHMPLRMHSDAELRRAVGAPPPPAMFPADPALLARVEKLLPADCALIVSGDTNFVSGGARGPGHATGEDHTRSVRIRLRGNHFELAGQPGRPVTAVARKKQSKPLRILRWDGSAPYLLAPDGTSEAITRERATSLLMRPHESPYVLIRPERLPDELAGPLGTESPGPKGGDGAAASAGSVAGLPAAQLAASRAAALAAALAAAYTFEVRRVAREVLRGATFLDFDAYRSYKDFGLDFWRYASHTIPAAAPLTSLEETAVAGALRGGLIYGERYDGPAVGFDVRSMYPWVMTGTFQLPLGEGAPMLLAEIPEIPPVGFYLASVAGIPPGLRKLWRGPRAAKGAAGAMQITRELFASAVAGGPATQAPTGWITHCDVATARKLGGRVVPAPGPCVNAIIYRSRRIKACQAFGGGDTPDRGFVPRLFAARNQRGGAPSPAVREGQKAPKRVLNILWGALGQRNLKEYRSVDASQITHELFADSRVVDTPVDWHSVHDFGDGAMVVRAQEPGTPRYVSNYARWPPFITAVARARMVDLLLPHAARVVRVHTDGWVLSCRGGSGSGCPYADLTERVGDGLGDLKIEGCGRVTVHNAMRVDWP